MAEIACPRCGTRMPYAPALVGREVFCLGCGAHFRVSVPVAVSGADDPSMPPQPGTPNTPSSSKPQSNGPPSRQDVD